MIEVRRCRARIAMIGVLLAAIIGCQAAPRSVHQTDTRLRRLADDGQELYAAGDIDAAIVKFEAAVRRAWAIDDPRESGTAAYNLAATLTSLGENGMARDWLADARHELRRAGASAGNAWLMEAKIATAEHRFDDASTYLCLAERGNPPCAAGQDLCDGTTPAGCHQCPLSRVPCIGPKIAAKQAIDECQDGFEAQIDLGRARLAAEQYDLNCAAIHLTRACERLQTVCSPPVHAELNDVAASLHIAKDEYLQAAWHFDREAELLQVAGVYRDLPEVLESAAAAYQRAGSSIQAAERYNRVARIYVGRGDTHAAWQAIREASGCVDRAPGIGQSSIRIRLSLVARQIQQMLGESS